MRFVFGIALVFGPNFVIKCYMYVTFAGACVFSCVPVSCFNNSKI